MARPILVPAFELSPDEIEELHRRGQALADKALAEPIMDHSRSELENSGSLTPPAPSAEGKRQKRPGRTRA